MTNNSIPEDIIKIQKKLASFEKDSRNYKKYTKILAKHVKSFTMKKRVLLYSSILLFKVVSSDSVSEIIISLIRL